MDPQRLFDEIRNRQGYGNSNVQQQQHYSNPELTPLEARILYALRELVKHFGVAILARPEIPAPLAEFCLRLQYIVPQYERVQPLDDEQAKGIFKETWITVLEDYGSEVDALMIECNE